MRRFFSYLGFISFLAIIYYAYQYCTIEFGLILQSFFYYFGIFVFVLLFLSIASYLYYGENWLVKSGLDFYFGSDLVEVTQQTFKELPSPSKTTLGTLAAHIVYRVTRIGLIGLIVASIPIWLLWQQNKKLDVQNEKIEFQNDRINIQNSLLEADRKSSLVFLMSNILDKVSSEIEDQNANKKEDKKYNLSQPTIQRIIALSKAFKPYRNLVNDTLSKHLISPERGQLFTSLMNINLDSTTQ